MRSIQEGQRGSAVEDVQRRLLSLGYSLGPTGVDGAYLEHTIDAVRAFQQRAGVEPNGIVDEQTWGLLVDATFSMGDRNLFLKHPFFHGRDVLQLQQAITVLGFTCGACDGIFGAFTERAIREFQANAGLTADGIVGDATFLALGRLRHVWEGKEPVSHSAAEGNFARAAETLQDLNLVLISHDEFSSAVAGRMVNLATATLEEASVVHEDSVTAIPRTARIIAHLSLSEGEVGMARVVFADLETLPKRIKTAIDQQESPASIAIELRGIEDESKQSQQSTAIRLLDAFCGAFASI